MKKLAIYTTGLAVLALIVASMATNILGLYESMPKTALSVVIITLILAVEIVGALLMVAGEGNTGIKRMLILVMAVGCMTASGIAGYRSLTHMDASRLAPYETSMENRKVAVAELAQAKTALASLPGLPDMTNMPATRISVAMAARDAELVRLEAAVAATETKLAGISVPAKPEAALPQAMIIGLILLVELIKACGLWVISANSRKPEAEVLTGIPLLADLLARGLISNADISSVHATVVRWKRSA